ncbi:MAG TPA: hypothetical protein VNC50_20690, partial [Planctomycetia bacterium]|nr:hypothetical protein [Planctomycetia bacterium]
KCRAAIFNHSTHTIGAVKPGVRSPSFYGLAAQELEKESGGVFCFLEGASGSTHNLGLAAPEALHRIKNAVSEGVVRGQARPVNRLAALKRPFEFTVREFDETVEERKVVEYCRKRMAAAHADSTAEVFRAQRKLLARLRGAKRTTWLQVALVGDVAIVGVPAEFFTKLGQDIKRLSPFRYTYVAELANDWIGYIPDEEGHRLGGYQTWTGLHSFAASGTGERIVAETVRMLHELHAEAPPAAFKR